MTQSKATLAGCALGVALMFTSAALAYPRSRSYFHYPNWHAGYGVGYGYVAGYGDCYWIVLADGSPVCVEHVSPEHVNPHR